MKVTTLYLSLAMSCMLFSGGTCNAQQLSTIAPIIVPLPEIDRYRVYVNAWYTPNRMRLGNNEIDLDIPYRDKTQAEVEALAKSGFSLNREVWIVDGDRVIAQCDLASEFIVSYNKNTEPEYGLVLRMDSIEMEYGLLLRMGLIDLAVEAKRMAGQELSVHDINELIKYYAGRLDDVRGWQDVEILRGFREY